MSLFSNIIIKYKKSFIAKLSLSGDETIQYYDELKNEILSYKKVKGRTSWSFESFRKGRKLLVRLAVRGKTLKLYIALDPKTYEGSKVKVLDATGVKRHAAVPCLYKIKNHRRVEYAKALIAEVMAQNGIEKSRKYDYVDFGSELVYRDLESLIANGFIKELQHDEVVNEAPIEEVSVYEVNKLMSDEEAEARVEASEREVNKAKKGIINVDTLSMYFDNDEIVTLEEIKRRVPGFDKKVTFLKVLARGTLSKRLIVDADDYSLDAEKMILLKGGRVLSTAVEEEEEDEE